MNYHHHRFILCIEEVRHMGAQRNNLYSEEELTRMEIREFIAEGLKDIKNNDLYEMDEVFDELESRYKNAKV